MPRLRSVSPRPLAALAAALAAALLAGCASLPGGGAGGAPARGLLLVLNKGAASATLLDPRTAATVATFPTGEGPHEVAVSPDGRLAVVTNYGGETPGSSLTVLDLAARQVARTVELAPHARPHGVAWLPDGRRVAVTLETDSLVALVDVVAGAVTARIGTGQRGSHMLALSPDGSRAYVSNLSDGTVSLLDLDGGFLLRTVPSGAGAEGIAVTPDGAELWVTNRAANTISILDAETLAPLDTLAAPGFPIRVAFSPAGRLAVVTSAAAGTLRLIDAELRAEVATIPMPLDSARQRPTMLGPEFGRGTGVPIGVLVAPDARTAYVANANQDLVTVVDLVRRAVTGTLPTGREPDGMGWVP